MSGLVKQKEYDWKDSNIANIGSNEDKNAKTTAALSEPAWKGAENMQENNGLKIWRIEKFEVKDWPVEKYGTFFNGDSYIILHTEKAPESDVILYDVHFWIGSKSTQDEYATAAYKTVELDAFLDDKAVQHREVGGYESEAFKEYFNNVGGIKINEGGIESGFRHVESKTQGTMIVHYKKVWNEELGRYTYEAVPPMQMSCDDGFLVIFSGEDRIIQLRGPNTPLSTNVPFNKWMSERKAEYPKAQLEVFDSQEELEKDKIYEVIYQELEQKENLKEKPEEFQKRLIRVITDKSMKLEFKVVATNGDINESLLDHSDVFLLETEEGLVVWVGKDASTAEKTNALYYAQEYLKEHGQNPICTVSCAREKVGKCPRVWGKNVKKQDKGVQQQMDRKWRQNHRM